MSSKQSRDLEGDEKLEGYRSSSRGSTSRDSSAEGGKYRKSRQNFRRGNSGRSDRRSQSRNSRSPAKGGGIPSEVTCLRCGSFNHGAGQCPHYREYCQSRCEDCTLYHLTSQCNQRRKNYKSPGGNQVRNSRKVSNKHLNQISLLDNQAGNVDQNCIVPQPFNLGTNLFLKN